MKNRYIILVLIVIAVPSIVLLFDLDRYLTLEYATQQRSYIQSAVDDSPYLSPFVFILIYTLVTALSIPGALILTLSAGALFGLTLGVVVALTGASFGATLAFLGSRYFARAWVEGRFPKQIKSVNHGLDRDGEAYLFALRLMPVFPFFLVNLLMGVTRIRTLTFFWVSAVGMLAATAVFVNAGTQISKIESLGDITSPGLLASFLLLGMFPIIANSGSKWWRLNKALKAFPKPKTFDRNLVVIGAGAGGLVSSYIAATVKAKVTLIEKHKMGGDCLNTGCVPSKALIKAARVAFDVGHASEFGISTGDVKIDFTKVMKHVHQSIKLVEPHDSVERYSKLGVECVQGDAHIASPYCVHVNGEAITCRSIIVATGATPFVPDFDGLSNIKYYTSDTIWNITHCPQRLLILGAGPIACELAQAFSRLGSQVTVLARSGRVMSKEDEEVSHFVMSALSKEGVELRMGHHVLGFGENEQGKFVNCEAAEGEAQIYFDEVLLALGRRANTEGFGLEALGVQLNENGTIKTDPYLRSSIPTIYACGDVAGPYQFTHMAAHQAWYASVNALFGWIKKFKVDYSVVPWVTYVDPEVARVGLNELDAIKKNVAYEVTRYHLNDLDRAITDNGADGFVKVLTVPGKDRILGVTIVGQHAGEVLAEFVLAMTKGIGLNGILGTIHSYPTMAEANKYVAGEWKRKHAPVKLLALVERLMCWRRG